MNLLAIDPGNQNSGWAFFDTSETDPDSRMLAKWGTVKSTKKFPDAMNDQIDGLGHVIDEYAIEHLVVEFPALHQSAGGMVTATSGALIKLTTLVGAIYGAFNEHCPVTFIPVMHWKGQLTKTVTQMRMSREYPYVKGKLSDHVWDAIGIGTYFIKTYGPEGLDHE